MGERNDLIERLRKRAEAEREIQRNNEAVVEALSGQLEAFHRRDGSHNNFAVRLGLDHRSCAKRDASLAADWEEAATTIARLSEALAEAEKKGAEDWQPIETAPKGKNGIAFMMLAFGPSGDQTVSEGLHFNGRFYAASVFHRVNPNDGRNYAFREHEVHPTHWRPTLAPPRDLSQGGQYG